jgi:hypothetical protein
MGGKGEKIKAFQPFPRYFWGALALANAPDFGR